jgi:repressor LexA
LEFLENRLEETGVFPSYREIGLALGIHSTNGVSDHLKALEKKGYVARVGTPGLSRSMRIVRGTREVDDQARTVDIPLVGRVAAGPLTAAFEDTSEALRIDRRLLPRNDQVIALSIRGDSMIDDGIHDGDTVFVDRGAPVRTGDIGIVRVDGDVTCKRVFKEGRVLRLQPANRDMEPIWVDPHSGEIEVVGKVVGVWRTIRS